MKKPIEIVNKDFDEYVVIQYALTNVCNYKCEYCWPQSHIGTSRWPDYDTICKNFDHLFFIYKTYFNKKIIKFNILGGEPTLWPRLGDFVKFIHSKHNCRISMSTNGSRTLRWWKTYSEYFNDIQISVHHKDCNVQHIKEIADYIYSKGTIMIAAVVMMDPSKWEKCVNIVNQLLDHPNQWMVKTKTLTQSEGDESSMINVNYNKEHMDYLANKIKRFPPDEYIKKMKEYGNIEQNKTSAIVKYDDGSEDSYKTFILYENKNNSFLGWHCNIGKDSFTIKEDGRIEGACGETNIYGDTIFNIFDKDFVEKFTPKTIAPVTCSRMFCGCSVEIRLPKRKKDV